MANAPSGRLSYRFPLSFQTVLPNDYGTSAAFQSLLETLRELSFWGVELNMSDPRSFEPEAVRSFLKGKFDLELSMLATGLTAKQAGLSLSHPSESVRQQSVEKCRQIVDWVAGSEAGVIVGFLKGGVAQDGEEARKRFARSLAEILPRAEERSVAVLIEATNRYESSVANTLEEAAGFLRDYSTRYAQILPDTFHMNIEEADMLESLRRHRDRFSSFHLSDNNRLFPGFGAIDFTRIIRLLRDIDYRGRLAIEGNVKKDVESDLRASITRLAPLLEA
jgi:sugar phosphate isomerase/epimerase